jgi:hypothetical protein
MARTQTMVQLTDELLGLLDDEARRRGVSRSALIREALDGYLAERRERDLARSIVEGYTRIPPATPDEWGDPEAQADRSTLELLRRLDAEEHASGESW